MQSVALNPVQVATNPAGKPLLSAPISAERALPPVVASITSGRAVNNIGRSVMVLSTQRFLNTSDHSLLIIVLICFISAPFHCCLAFRDRFARGYVGSHQQIALARQPSLTP